MAKQPQQKNLSKSKITLNILNAAKQRQNAKPVKKRYSDSDSASNGSDDSSDDENEALNIVNAAKQRQNAKPAKKYSYCGSASNGSDDSSDDENEESEQDGDSDSNDADSDPGHSSSSSKDVPKPKNSVLSKPVVHCVVNSAKRTATDASNDSQDDRSKRPKLSDSLRHPRFWYSDANVVIKVENTLYKIHRSQFARQSPSFAALFRRDIPSKDSDESDEDESGEDESGEDESDEDESDEGESDEGESDDDGRSSLEPCALDGVTVEARDDESFCDLSEVIKAADFEALLTAMDDSIGYHHKTPDLPVIYLILNAAQNLGFTTYADFAKTILVSVFPDSILDIPEFDKDALQYVHAGTMICRARDPANGLSSTLKRAFYELARAPQDLCPFDDLGKAKDSFREACRLGAAKDHLSRAWLSLVTSTPSISEDCSDASCRINKIRYRKLLGKGDLLRYGADPLRGIQVLLDTSETDVSACSECFAAWMAFLEDERTEIWEGFAEWLDISDS
ncbi:hypothetical protein HGRIS_004367 [Hohenbuehelia grisea]|uniref:BTB domain-containing protein n=1 Tax=Hohenbuehelia grisea TaxID=104357 RepID=A0ABR3JCT5_9AGAR